MSLYWNYRFNKISNFITFNAYLAERFKSPVMSQIYETAMSKQYDIVASLRVQFNIASYAAYKENRLFKYENNFKEAIAYHNSKLEAIRLRADNNKIK